MSLDRHRVALERIVARAGSRPPYSQMALDMWRVARTALAADEELPQDRKAIIDALRILQDRTIGSSEANKRAIDVLTAGLAGRGASQ